MTRPKRINLPFTLYHVLSRTNSGDDSFRDSRDYSKFIEYLSRYISLFDFKLHAYCLMTNHFHLLLESGNQNALSEFMRRLLTAYTVYFNRRHKRHGHLFQGRFKSLVVDKADYLLSLSSYIHNNPARGGKSINAEFYQWSSLAYYANGGEPDFLDTREILSWFRGKRKEYIRFVREGLKEQTKPEIISQRYIGGGAFVRRLTKRLKDMDQSGTRADQTLKKGKALRHESEQVLATKILEQTARQYKCTPEILIRPRLRQDSLTGARTVLINLLREALPWTYLDIARFMNLKDKTSVNYHLGRMEKDSSLKRVFQMLRNEKSRK